MYEKNVFELYTFHSTLSIELFFIIHIFINKYLWIIIKYQYDHRD